MMQPVAYAVFAENGNIRIWCADPIQAQTLREIHGDDLKPLYHAPAAPDVSQWPIRGVRVEDDKVIITVKGGNDSARQLCGEILALKQGGAS